MSINDKVPLFTELINEESAVISGGALPIFIYDGTTARILNVDGQGQEVILTLTSPTISPLPQPNNDLTNQLSL
ncbi:hypothetical protein [Nostoc sp. UHCC 0870]|uniref:hypothetical protein n=1 Tax=Nostoc sp. UHCC 0870 TaxID=2914041 RepID=UPI001EDFF463|nr:hypothetical protein [Nostoc sp. UHCC 0870]UKO97198.1 hypothetical protein L6494_21815 [Nostoc sp. UHCC 0870]